MEYIDNRYIVQGGAPRTSQIALQAAQELLMNIVVVFYLIEWNYADCLL